jgi:nucleoprotein TPR
MALVESQNARGDQMAEELSKQHQKNVQLNKDITTLQQNIQAAQSAASSAKYKADNLRQQLDQISRHNEDLQTQLNTKADENLKLRREKGARISELQRQNEDARVEIDNLKRTETRLRDQVQTWQAKADEALAKVQQQQEAFARTEESYKREL